MSDVDLLIASIFFVCVGGIAWTYVLYPALIALASLLFGHRRNPPAGQYEPTISIVIAAHNEATMIVERIRNVLELDYPREKLEIVIASDGSTDETANLVREFEADGVRLFEYARGGKPATLNRTIPQLSGEILLLSDANTFFDRQVARRLGRWFSDPKVGTVCGRLLLTDPKTGTNADSLYWKYENRIKQCEARLGALLGANGAVYAIRASTYVPISDRTLVDDFVIPLLSKLHTQSQIVYDRTAVAYETTPAFVRDEFQRRARIGAGGYQSILMLWKLLLPQHGWTALALFSHKLVRWVCPFLMLGAFVSNLYLARYPVFAALLAAQVAFYLTAAVVGCLPTSWKWAKPLRLAAMFVSMNSALMVGFWRFVTSQQRSTWRRTSRAHDVSWSGAGGVSKLPLVTVTDEAMVESF